MKFYCLTITKIFDKIALANAFKDIFCTMPAKERLALVSKTPIEFHEMHIDPDHIYNVLDIHCEYEYLQEPYPPGYYGNPWESPAYIAAKNWYNKLSKEDRDKVDLLIKSSGPWA